MRGGGGGGAGLPAARVPGAGVKMVKTGVGSRKKATNPCR